MTINLQKPDITELKPRITVFGVGGGGGNAVNNMITAGLAGRRVRRRQHRRAGADHDQGRTPHPAGRAVTEGLGAGSQPEVGRAAAEECIDEIIDHLSNTHMCFVTAGMGGGTGTGAAPVVARAAREKGILTVGVVTKPFQFEGQRRMRSADHGIEELQKYVDTLIVIPNQNLFRIANDKTTFADAFAMADQVLYSGVACITDLMVKEGLINLDFADVRSVMREMGKAMMGTGEASGEGRAMAAAEAAIANPLLDETSMKGAKGLLISITGGRDLTLFEVDEAATRIREEVDPDANIILGATFDEELEGIIRVSVVATGIDKTACEIAAAPIAIRQAGQAAPARAGRRRRSRVARSRRRAARPGPSRSASPKRSAQAETDRRRDAPRRSARSAGRRVPPAEQAVPAPPGRSRSQASGSVAAGGRAAAAGRRTGSRRSRSRPQRRSRACRESRTSRRREGRDRGQRARTGAQQEERGPMGLLEAADQSACRAARKSRPSCSRRSRASRSCASRRRRPAASRRRTRSSTRRAAASSTSTAAWSPQPRASQEDDQFEIPAFLRRQAN